MPQLNPPSDPIAHARSGAESLVELYDRWADTYDKDVFERSGVVGTRRIATLLAATLTSRDSWVIDLGCGTGVAGEHLSQAGLTSLTGVDISVGMLRRAAQRQVYRGLVAADLLATMPFRDHSFDAAVCAGTFMPGHVGPACLGEISRILRPEARFGWVVHETLWPAFERAMADNNLVITSATPEVTRSTGDDLAMMVLGVRAAG